MLGIILLFFNVYDTFKALKPASRPSQRAAIARKRGLKGCVCMWVVWACWKILELVVDRTLGWLIPFYGTIKLLIFLSLIFTRTRGAEPIYINLIRPLLKSYAQPIDAALRAVDAVFSIILFLAISPFLGIYQRFTRPAVPPPGGDDQAPQEGREQVNGRARMPRDVILQAPREELEAAVQAANAVYEEIDEAQERVRERQNLRIEVLENGDDEEVKQPPAQLRVRRRNLAPQPKPVPRRRSPSPLLPIPANNLGPPAQAVPRRRSPSPALLNAGNNSALAPQGEIRRRTPSPALPVDIPVDIKRPAAPILSPASTPPPAYSAPSLRPPSPRFLSSLQLPTSERAPITYPQLPSTHLASSNPGGPSASVSYHSFSSFPSLQPSGSHIRDDPARRPMPVPDLTAADLEIGVPPARPEEYRPGPSRRPQRENGLVAQNTRKEAEPVNGGTEKQKNRGFGLTPPSEEEEEEEFENDAELAYKRPLDNHALRRASVPHETNKKGAVPTKLGSSLGPPAPEVELFRRSERAAGAAPAQNGKRRDFADGVERVQNPPIIPLKRKPSKELIGRHPAWSYGVDTIQEDGGAGPSLGRAATTSRSAFQLHVQDDPRTMASSSGSKKPGMDAGRVPTRRRKPDTLDEAAAENDAFNTTSTRTRNMERQGSEGERPAAQGSTSTKPNSKPQSRKRKVDVIEEDAEDNGGRAATRTRNAEPHNSEDDQPVASGSISTRTRTRSVQRGLSVRGSTRGRGASRGG